MTTPPDRHEDANRILERLARLYDDSMDDGTTPAEEADRGATGEESESDERVKAGIWSGLHLLRRIGTGSQGDVYEAFDPLLRRREALKIVRKDPDGTRNVEVRAARALDEARTLASVKFEGVVHIHGIEETADDIGLRMEYIEGENLEDALEARGRSSNAEVAVIGLELCRALAAVHKAGIVHGDVKSTNVMRELSGRIVLMDFGVSRRVETGRGHVSSGIAGSPLYMAPETLRGGELTPASDVYSLGVLLYRLSTGRYPVEAKTYPELVAAHKKEHRRRLRDDAPGASEALVEVIERAILPNPKHRFRSAGDMQQALARTLPQPGRVPVRRLAGAGLVVLLGVVLYAAKDQVTAILPYDIDASFHAAAEEGNARRVIREGMPVQVGEGLFIEVRASAPLWIYVIATNPTGATSWNFPLGIPGVEGSNPVAPNQLVELPGRDRSHKIMSWCVDDIGEVETFLLVASRVRLSELERDLETYLRPSFPEQRREENKDLTDEMRGTQRLAQTSLRSGAGSPKVVTTWLDGARRLVERPERTRGVWIRRADFPHAEIRKD